MGDSGKVAQLHQTLCSEPGFDLPGLFAASEKRRPGQFINLDTGDSNPIIKAPKPANRGNPVLQRLDQLNHQMHDFEDSLAIVEADTTLCKILFYLENQHLQLV